MRARVKPEYSPEEHSIGKTETTPVFKAQI